MKLWGYKYFFTGRNKNTFFFRALYHYREYDCPDYDYTRIVRQCKVYVYPFHSPCYYLRTRVVRVKNGVSVDHIDSGWKRCKVSELLASSESVATISDVCGIRVYMGAWK